MSNTFRESDFIHNLTIQSVCEEANFCGYVHLAEDIHKKPFQVILKNQHLKCLPLPNEINSLFLEGLEEWIYGEKECLSFPADKLQSYQEHLQTFRNQRELFLFFLQLFEWIHSFHENSSEERSISYLNPDIIFVKDQKIKVLGLLEVDQYDINSGQEMMRFFHPTYTTYTNHFSSQLPAAYDYYPVIIMLIEALLEKEIPVNEITEKIDIFQLREIKNHTALWRKSVEWIEKLLNREKKISVEEIYEKMKEAFEEELKITLTIETKPGSLKGECYLNDGSPIRFPATYQIPYNQQNATIVFPEELPHPARDIGCLYRFEKAYFNSDFLPPSKNEIHFKDFSFEDLILLCAEYKQWVTLEVIPTTPVYENIEVNGISCEENIFMLPAEHCVEIRITPTKGHKVKSWKIDGWKNKELKKRSSTEIELHSSSMKIEIDFEKKNWLPFIFVILSIFLLMTLYTAFKDFNKETSSKKQEQKNTEMKTKIVIKAEPEYLEGEYEINGKKFNFPGEQEFSRESQNLVFHFPKELTYLESNYKIANFKLDKGMKKKAESQIFLEKLDSPFLEFVVKYKIKPPTILKITSNIEGFCTSSDQKEIKFPGEYEISNFSPNSKLTFPKTLQHLEKQYQFLGFETSLKVEKNHQIVFENQNSFSEIIQIHAKYQKLISFITIYISSNIDGECELENRTVEFPGKYRIPNTNQDLIMTFPEIVNIANTEYKLLDFNLDSPLDKKNKKQVILPKNKKQQIEKVLKLHVLYKNETLKNIVKIGRNSQGFMEYRRTKDNMVMVEIPEGPFLLAQTMQEEGLSRYLIDKYEVSAKQYIDYINESRLSLDQETEQFYKNKYQLTRRLGHYSIPKSKEKLPIVYVSFREAKNYAKWASVDLPNELEWQKAAIAESPLKREYYNYSWGNHIPTEKQYNLNGKIKEVDLYPQGASYYGLLNMSGNVAEFCKGDINTIEKPLFKGGSFRGGIKGLKKIYETLSINASTKKIDIGFRGVFRFE